MRYVYHRLTEKASGFVKQTRADTLVLSHKRCVLARWGIILSGQWTLSKYPLEKLFYFVAGIIPGFVALLVYQQAVPDAFKWFFSVGFLGYRVKLAVATIVACIIGNTLTTFFSSFLGAIGGAVGSVLATRRTPQLSFLEDVAPWRDARWRALAKKQLGANAPDDTTIMSRQIFEQRSQMVELLPEGERESALIKLRLEKGKNDLDDMHWENWYDHYHHVILQPESRPTEWYVQNGFNFSLQTTSVYVLLSSPFVPSVRQWWCIGPACFWLFLLVAESYASVRRLFDKWATLDEQIRYLSGLP